MIDERTVARFWAKVDRRGPDECWLWTDKPTEMGYGRFRLADNTKFYAHRLAYVLLVDEIPSGLLLDHDCHNRADYCPGGVRCRHRLCVNPAHLIVSTDLENNRRAPWASRRTGCVHGHPYTPENTFNFGLPGKKCRVCKRARDKLAYHRRNAA